GKASFCDPHTLAVEPENATGVLLKADTFLIATGSHPFHPEIFPFYSPRVYDSDTILNLHDIPPTMLVAGGGVIGCEYACMFAALGVKVSLVEGREDMKLLGVQILGEQANELIHIGLQAIMLKANADLFIQTCFNYPTLSELYKYATYDALGKRAQSSGDEPNPPSP
ncbi:MAG: pyruvate/2-oxoglutarate dehydrogenase complex dihydrolipoamide dehydrogenase (E3) component, partial [Limisphaerales bacterium]